MRFPFCWNRDSVKNGILISIRRTGDGFHPGLFNGEISKEEYDEWRYKYPELDTYQKRAKVPSQELSDYLVKELTKKEK